ncbi:unnamed protein product, partial [Ectocarpus fasciculatus]
MRSDQRLVKMWWDGGLVMVSAIIKDAAGGTGLPGIAPTYSPWKLTIEALGTKVEITAPAGAKNKDGFVAGCGGNVGVNPVKLLRRHLQSLSHHIADNSWGGHESLRRVDNLKQKRTVLRQMNVILKEGNFIFNPALGGIWIKVRHCPSTMSGPGEWNTGFATPTINFHVLMRRERLADTGGLAVQENREYVDAAAAAAMAAAAAAAAAEEEEEEEERKRRR